MKWRHAAAAGAEVLPGANIGLVHLLRSRGWHVTAGQPACEAWPASSTGRCNSQWDGGARPLLNADVLAALRSMGHGDELVVSDANFPADAIARQTVLGHILRMDGVDAPRAVRAILSVVPLDSFVEHPAMRMEVVDAPDEI